MHCNHNTVSGEANFDMKRTGLTVGGFIQPSIARNLLEQNASIEKGLCQRVLWCVPKPTVAIFEELEKVDQDFSASIGMYTMYESTDCPTTLSYPLQLQMGNISQHDWDSFNFDIVNFHTYTPSQLVWIGRICSSFVQFKDRHYKLDIGIQDYVRHHKHFKHIEEGICFPALAGVDEIVLSGDM